MPIPHTFVALLDVLGYKNKIKADRESLRESFKNSLESALAIFAGINEAEIGYQAISDTIIVTAHPATPLVEFLAVLARVQRSFLRNGLFIRGGIAFAQHFKSGTLTYSHALPVAYELEQKQAVYPRIVIDSNIVQMIGSGEKLESEAQAIKDGHFICVENGVYFLNIAQDSLDECYELARSIYDADKDFLEGNEHELAKHRWFQNFLIAMSEQPIEPYMKKVSIFDPVAHFGL